MHSVEKSEEEVLAVRCAFPECDEDAQADGAGAGFLQGFDLAEADERGELVAFVDDGFGVGGSGFEGVGEDVGGELLEIGGGGCGLSRHPDFRILGFAGNLLRYDALSYLRTAN